MGLKCLFSGMALSIVIAGAAFAEDTECEARGTNGMVTLVLCPAGLDEAALVVAGKAACGDRKPCGAWIWDDVANVPTETPERHDLLPKDSVTSALAIWVNEKDQLVKIQKSQ